MNDKKKHHYIPIGYLRAFQGTNGQLCVYRKDEPEARIFLTPANVAFHKYYYSQPTPDGGQDNDTLENTFSELEEKWPPLAERIVNKEGINDELETLLSFIILQRVRVPAARDGVEKLHAEMVRLTAKQLKNQGKFPKAPASLPYDIIDTMQISIDPHQSLHSMVYAIEAIGELIDRMGFDALHNNTDIDFITSDNPVIWFDPTVPPQDLQPYNLQAYGPIKLFFPISPRVVLVGDTERKERFARFGLEHLELKKKETVKVINREVVRFAYDAVFAKSDSVRPLVNKYADISPITDVDHIGDGDDPFMIHRSVFGKRTKKPKWRSDGNPPPTG